MRTQENKIAATIHSLRAMVSFAAFSLVIMHVPKSHAADVSQQSRQNSLTPAHIESEAFNIDPLYNATRVTPAADFKPDAIPWVYGDGQLEAWKINELVTEGFKANNKVGYDKNYSRVAPRSLFRHLLKSSAAKPVLARGNGAISASIDGKTFLQEPSSVEKHTIILPPDSKPGAYLEIEVIPEIGEPGALLIEQKEFSTAKDWEWSGDGKTWSPAVAYPQTLSGIQPHRLQEPTKELKPLKVENGIYDFGIPVLGRPILRCKGEPAVFPGESIAEASDSGEQSELNRSVKQLPDGRWTTLYPMGFRYLRVVAQDPSDLVVEAAFHPVRYKGAFACSDEKLTRIWMHCAFTLRSCMHLLMLDGIKRDRMPWIGDQASNLFVNAFTLAEPDIIRESFTALGRPSKGYINGIVDYSLWWVINQELYQQYFDDPAYLQREWPHINLLLKNLTDQRDAEGLFHPASGWVFIDWGLKNDKKRTNTSLQIMLWWAQQSAALLAQKAGDAASAAFWKQKADTLGKTLHDRAWNAAASSWQEYLETPDALSPYPNLLAMVSGLAHPEQYPGIRRNLLDHPGRGTPFMKGFELLALSQAGDPEAALQRISSYWGEMLDAGATTFWEDFKQEETNHYSMYKRPFGRSLCHAWASGPAAIMPMIIFGVRPLEDGWKKFTIKPHLGYLKTASATVPTPHGNIELHCDTANTTVTIPQGTTLICGKKNYPGPDKVTFPTPP